jgi:CP family cyanate transporter-like MFS transporter
MTVTRGLGGVAGLGLAAALLLVAFNLRGAFVAVSSVLPDVGDDTGLAEPALALLTTLPVVCFAAFAPLVPGLARRQGMDRVLVLALAVLTCGVLVRLAPGNPALFAGTLLIGAGIAVGNVLLPALIKRDFPAHIGTMTGLYVTSMGIGATVAAGGTVFLDDATGLGWRAVIALWSIPAAAALLFWLPRLRRRRTDARVEEVALRAMWRDTLAWQVVVFMGLQSLIYYSATAWLPTLFVGRGLSEVEAGFQLGVFNLISLPASLAVPMLAARTRDQVPLVVAACAMTAAGLLGLVAAPEQAPLAWMTLLGLGQGATVGLAFTLIGLRSPDTVHASQLSSMVHSASFLIAATGPLAMAALHSAVSSWQLVFVLPLVAVVPMTISGIAAGRDRYVGAPVVASGSPV